MLMIAINDPRVLPIKLGLRGIVWVIFDSTQAYHIEIMEIFRVSY